MNASQWVMVTVLCSAAALADGVERKFPGCIARIELPPPSDGESDTGESADAEEAMVRLAPRIREALQHYRGGKHRYQRSVSSLLLAPPSSLRAAVEVHFRVAQTAPGVGFGLEAKLFLNVDPKLSAEARHKVGSDFILSQLQKGGVLAEVKPAPKGSIQEADRWMDALLESHDLTTWIEVARRYEPWVRELAARSEPMPLRAGYTAPTGWLVAKLVVAAFDGTAWPEDVWTTWRALPDAQALTTAMLMITLLDDAHFAAGLKRLKSEAATRKDVEELLKPWLRI